MGISHYIYSGINIVYEENDTGKAVYMYDPTGRIAKKITINNEITSSYIVTLYYPPQPELFFQLSTEFCITNGIFCSFYLFRAFLTIIKEKTRKTMLWTDSLKLYMCLHCIIMMDMITWPLELLTGNEPDGPPNTGGGGGGHPT